MEASLDTNVLLRFALRDIPDQFVRARTVLARPDARYRVADAVWLEMAYVLGGYYHLDRPAIVDVITSLMGIDSVVTDAATITAACTLFIDHPKLSFADCYLGAYADQTHATPLLTFDEKLASQHPSASLVPLDD